MKKTILLLLILFSFVSASEIKRPFIWVDDEDYKPMIYKDKNGKPAGIFNDIMSEIFKRLNIPLKKAVYPWKRTQKLVKEGKADAMVTVYTKERQKFMIATEPIWYVNETLFFRRDNPKACKLLKVNSFEELKDFTVTETIGSGWSKEQFKKYGIKNIIWVPDTESAFNVLAKKRADVYFTSDIYALELLKQKQNPANPFYKDYQQIVAITPPFIKLPFRLLIRKDSPYAKLVPKINKVLKEMKKDGTYKKIIQKYIYTNQINKGN